MDRQELTARDHLRQFLSPDFDAQIVPMGSAESVRELIRSTAEYRSAKRALDSGAITERVLREFVSDLMGGFEAGKKFQFETALAALATVCESHFVPFAEELLIDLAALKLAEIGHAIRVARACLQHRIRLPRTRSKTYVVSRAAWNSQANFGQAVSVPKRRTPTKEQAYAIP